MPDLVEHRDGDLLFHLRSAVTDALNIPAVQVDPGGPLGDVIQASLMSALRTHKEPQGSRVPRLPIENPLIAVVLNDHSHVTQALSDGLGQSGEGLLGHLANDGASCADDGDVERYLAESAEKAKACLVPLCIPLMGLVLAEDVSAGEELLVTYGYDAWLRTPPEATHSKAVEDLLRKGATQYAGLTLMASERYGDALKRLSNFVRTGSTEDAPAPPPKRAKRKKKPTSGGFG